MTTIVNSPAPQQESDGGIGMILGFIIIAVIVVLFFAYGLPAIRQTASPQINIPDKIDININQSEK